MNATRQIPIITLAFMLAALLFLSEGEESCNTCTDKRDTCESCPKRHIRRIAGLRNIGYGLELIVELCDNGFALMDSNRNIRRKFVLLICLIADFGNHIIADAKTGNMNLTILVSNIFLAECVSGDIGTFNAEGKSFKHTILRGLFDTNISDLCFVDKAVTSFIFNNYRLAVFFDEERVGSFIKILCLRQ